jgi:hypothetical protein
VYKFIYSNYVRTRSVQLFKEIGMGPQWQGLQSYENNFHISVYNWG